MIAARMRGRLFWKYLAVFMLLVGGVLFASSAVELYFSYDEIKRSIAGLEQEKALSAAYRIEQFVLSVERDVRGTLYPSADESQASQAETKAKQPGLSLSTAIALQREIDFLRLLKSTPAITDIRHISGVGKEQLNVSRVALDLNDNGRDLAGTPEFQAAQAKKRYFSPVYFRNESEPYMSVAVALNEPAPEVTVAEVNLKAIWDVVSQIRVGSAGYAYVVDAGGRLIAHPDISMVLQKRDLSKSPQVVSARAQAASPVDEDRPFTISQGLAGGEVLVAHAAIAQLGWLVFVEQPLAEVLVPLRTQIIRSVIILMLGLALSVLTSIVLARRMVAPIRRLQEGAARVGRGELDHRIDVRTGDELEALSDEFNSTTAKLQDSQANLEQKVAARTAELTLRTGELDQANALVTALNTRLQSENLRMGDELEVTRRLQLMLLPGAAELQGVEGLDIAGHMQPAVEVGGDYFDVLQHQGRVKIGIGDVTGHGLESGVLMVMTQAIVRALLTSGETDHVRFLSTLNLALFGNVQRMGGDKNLTLCLLDYAAGEVKISGQHEEMIVVRKGGSVERVDTIDLGFPVGLVDDISAFVGQATVRLEPGDGIVLYTDGITEAENMAREQYGLERLCATVSRHWSEPAEAIKDAVVADVAAYIGAQTVYDDITLVVLKQQPTKALAA